MTPEGLPAAQWQSGSGDLWAQRWRETDAALEALSPHLLAAVAERAPNGPFAAFEVGCGPGSTTIDIAEAFPRAAITACDISPALAAIAKERLRGLSNVQVLAGDAEELAADAGPFDLIFSRHGLMFFNDPRSAFRALRNAANAGGSLIFSCFRDWRSNTWASTLADAAADRLLPEPGREPSGFAFADQDYVRDILDSSGWSDAQAHALDFNYVAGRGERAVDDALSFLSELGPAGRVLQAMPEERRAGALERMRGVIEQHVDGDAVVFAAAAWIWRAKAEP